MITGKIEYRQKMHGSWFWVMIFITHQPLTILLRFMRLIAKANSDPSYERSIKNKVKPHG
jgi:hypothetical protein